ncbi:MAG: hypothetical protein KUG77_30420 [Nannocystaceae bacterium]|nr:hypothetical protein [Nannocystaceae bacterium]
MKGAWLRISVAVALLGVGGCTRVSDTARFKANAQTVEITATMPPAGGSVFPDMSVRLCWSDLIDPQSLTDVDALVGSGDLLTDARLGFELRPWTSPEGEQLVDGTTRSWCEGSVVTVTPKEPLIAGVRYRMRLADAAVGWEGEQPNLQTPWWMSTEGGDNSNFFLEFDVVPSNKPPQLPEEPTPAVTLTSLFEAGAVFDPQRAMCSCHRDSEDDANLRLDLSSPEAAYEDLLFDSRLRDTGYPMITPRRPSESFLLHKVLRDEGDALRGVFGTAMPPGDDALPYGDYVMLARWIEDGAQR